MAEAGAANAMKSMDTNGDGVINLTEAKFAAAAVIVKIDKDHNGVLNNDELAGRVVVVDQILAGRWLHVLEDQGYAHETRVP